MTNEQPTRNPAFFNRSADDVARDLLGDTLISTAGEDRTGGPIIETEAYLSERDDANHALQSGKTERNRAMFGSPGTVYVYLIYGQYHCMNIVCGERDVPEAVLIRAIDPRIGRESMKSRRTKNRSTPVSREELASGPGKLCMALAIDRSMNETSVCEAGPLRVLRGTSIRSEEIREGPRVGIEYADRASDWPLRFQIAPQQLREREKMD